MKTKYPLLLLLTAVFIFSCSQDSNDQQLNEPSSNLVSELSKYDNSNMGTYKGVFTTLDSQLRGSLVISLRNDNIAMASLSLMTGEVVIFSASNYVTGKTIKNLYFEVINDLNGESNFIFSVDNNGTNPEVSNVIFNSIDSSILIAKDTSRAPATAISGTYTCANCQSFPAFASGTFNNLVIGAGNGAIFSTSVVVNGNTHLGEGTQDGCDKTGNIWTCNTVIGRTMVGEGVIYWSGIHQYPNSAQTCSNLIGAWSFTKNGVDYHGTFQDDDPNPCP